MAEGGLRERLRVVTEAALSQGTTQEAMKVADSLVKECAGRDDAVLLASNWVEYGAQAGDFYLLWAAGAILETVSRSSKLWLRADAKVRNYSCTTLLKACSTCVVLQTNPWISAKIQNALGNQVIHEWPDNFPEFGPTVNQGFGDLSPCVIQLSTVVLNRAAEIAVGRNSTQSFRKFGSISMSNREKLQAGLREIVPFLFQAASAALQRMGDALRDDHSQQKEMACKAVLGAISECVKIAEENAIKLQVETAMIQTIFGYAKTFANQQSLALECIAEITSQSSISVDDDTYFKFIMQELIEFFVHCKQKGDEGLAKILMNIACILISKHITRLETSPNLGQTLVQLLTEIFQISFEINNHAILLHSLDVWEIILEHVESERDASYRSQNPLSQMYKSCNLSVANAILRRLFLHTQEGQAMLSKVDDTPGSALESLSEIQLQEHAQGRDISDFSELDHFHSRCEEIFGLLLDIYPDTLLQVCIQCFQELNTTYGSLINESGNVFKCGEGLATASHDISTCLRIVTRCAPKFNTIDKGVAESVYYFVVSIANHILGVYDTAARFNFPQPELEKVGKYADLNGKLAYNCLSMFTMWIRFLTASGAGSNVEGIVHTYLDTSVKAFEMSGTNKTLSSNMLISAAGALSSFSMVVQPSLQQMQALQSFQKLLGLLHMILTTAPQRAASSIWVFLADSLLKRMDPKQKELEHLAQIDQEFTRLVSMPAEILVRAATSGIDPVSLGPTQSAAHSLTALVRSFGGKTHSARMLLSKAMSPVLPSCMALIKAIAQNPSSTEHTGKMAQNIINLLIACFDVISKEMGDDFISTTVKEFIEMYSNPYAMKSLSVDTGASLMELLTLLARRPGSKFKVLSMQTIEWSLGIWPNLGGGGGVTHTDVLQLLCRVLRYQWRSCTDAHVQGVLTLMVHCFQNQDPSSMERFILDEIVKLDDQTKFFSSSGFGLNKDKALALACSLLSLVEVRLDMQEVLLAVLYRMPKEVLQMAVQQKTTNPNLLQAFFAKFANSTSCADFGSSLLSLMNDASFLASLS